MNDRSFKGHIPQSPNIGAIDNSYAKYIGVHSRIITALSLYLIIQRIIGLAKYHILYSSDQKTRI